MDFGEIVKKSKEIRQKYNVLNRLEGYKSWGAPEYSQALVGDVGDLQKLLMAKKGFWFSPGNVDEKLAKELSDCLWGVLAVADELDVDIEKEFLKTVKKLEAKIVDRKVVKKKKGSV